MVHFLIYKQTPRLIMPARCFVLQGQSRVKGQRLSSSEEIWQRLQPVVKCSDDTMTLTVRRRQTVGLLLDRGETTAQFKRDVHIRETDISTSTHQNLGVWRFCCSAFC